jgi:hypothetical protein
MATLNLSGEHSPASIAAADLADLRTRARAIMGNRFLTTASRVAMLRENEIALRAALGRWRALSGIASVASDTRSVTAAKGRYAAW